MPLPAGRGKADLHPGAFNQTVAVTYCGQCRLCRRAVGQSGRPQRCRRCQAASREWLIEDGPARLVAAEELRRRRVIWRSAASSPWLLNRLTQPTELAGRVDVGTSAPPQILLQLSVRGGSVSVNGHGWHSPARWLMPGAKRRSLTSAARPGYQVDLRCSRARGCSTWRIGDAGRPTCRWRVAGLPDTVRRDLHRQIAALPPGGGHRDRCDLHGPVALWHHGVQRAWARLASTSLPARRSGAPGAVG